MNKSFYKNIVKENELNKLIKDQKYSGSREFILFTSVWDEVSSTLLKKLKSRSLRRSISIINSFDTPHSFVIWGIKTVPSLVVLEGRGADKRVIITSHTTDIYKRLGLEK
tara:strand:- start:34 stop:363 length:330 start_codon:yes stop_codon:yes gene_type:complete